MGVLSTVAAPVGLVAGGWALAHHKPQTVLAATLALQLASASAIALAALRERTTTTAQPPERLAGQPDPAAMHTP
jgi:hypothetical protein